MKTRSSARPAYGSRFVVRPVGVLATAIERYAHWATLLCVLAFGCAPAVAATRLQASLPTGDSPRGTLLVVGGGAQPEALVRHFVDLAGGPGKARIAILPMASSDAAAAGTEKEAQLDSLGADSFVVNVTRAHADDDSVVRALRGVTGIWFPGGDQSRLTAALQGSAARESN
jgi:cyanophycinase